MPDSFFGVPFLASARIQKFLERADALIPGAISAVWVEGSLALQDFHPKRSDIDLVILSRRAISAPEQKQLALSGSPPLQLTWLTEEELAGLPERGNGLGAVTSATLLQSGLTIRGPHPKEKIPTVSHEALKRQMQRNLAEYWQVWLKECQSSLRQRLASFHPIMIEWGVFGVPRQYVTIKEGRIVSKSEGGRIVREIFPPRWHRIIDEALRLRTGRGERQYGSPLKRRQAMLDFLSYAIEATKALA